jgi:hypothetical protein
MFSPASVELPFSLLRSERLSLSPFSTSLQPNSVKFGININGNENKIEGYLPLPGFKFDSQKKLLEPLCPIELPPFEEDVTLTFKSELPGKPFECKGLEIFRMMYGNKEIIKSMFAWNGLLPYRAIVLESSYQKIENQTLILTSEAQYGGTKTFAVMNAIRAKQPVPYTAKNAIFRIIKEESDTYCEHYPKDLLGESPFAMCNCTVVDSYTYSKDNFPKIFQAIDLLETFFETIETYGYQISLLTNLICLTPYFEHEKAAFRNWIQTLKNYPASMHEVPFDVVYNVVTLIPLMIESSSHYNELNEAFVKYCHLFNLEAPGTAYSFSQLFQACCNQTVSLVSTAIKVHMKLANEARPAKFNWVDVLAGIRLYFTQMKESKGQKQIIVEKDDKGKKSLKLASLPPRINEKADKMAREAILKTVDEVSKKQRREGRKRKSAEVEKSTENKSEQGVKKVKRQYKKRAAKLQVKTSAPPAQKKKVSFAEYQQVMKYASGESEEMPDENTVKSVQALVSKLKIRPAVEAAVAAAEDSENEEAAGNEDNDSGYDSSSGGGSKYQTPTASPSGKLASHLRQATEEEEEEKANQEEEKENAAE